MSFSRLDYQPLFREMSLRGGTQTGPERAAEIEPRVLVKPNFSYFDFDLKKKRDQCHLLQFPTNFNIFLLVFQTSKPIKRAINRT